MVKVIIRVITFPFRLIRKFLGRATPKSVRTIETTGAGELARRTGTKENLDTAEREAAGQIGRSWLFTELPRPLLSEGNAADLSLEEARSISEQAEKFYSHDFSLFAKSDLFYEEVEQNYLNQALG
ncbi:MAG: hypothetical protein V3V30_07695, partial [Parvularculaceae bacterium]